MPTSAKPRGVWNADDCALLIIDYQQEMFDGIHGADPRLVELNIVTLATVARRFDIPVILSTVGVEMGVNGPSIPGLRNALPGVVEIDRSSMDAWEDPAFLAAVGATDRSRLVMCGLYTSVCLAYPAVDALADGFEVMFIADAVADMSREEHEIAAARLAHAGAVPNTSIGIMSEWFRDWKSPRADIVREAYPPYLQRVADLKGRPSVLPK